MLPSRVCAGCSYEPRDERFASLACGHAVCRWCLTETPSCCLSCKVETGYIRIYEEGPQCGICLTEQPLQRSMFSGCGHTLCEACMGQLWFNAIVYGQRFACHQCRRGSRPVQLKEHKITPGINRKSPPRGKVHQRKGITKAMAG